MALFDWLNGGITPAEIRAEVWSLGVRHHGEPLKGALEELAQGAEGRTALLKACVRELSR